MDIVVSVAILFAIFAVLVHGINKEAYLIIKEEKENQ